ncbi:MAG: DUF5662 family protein [Nanoarchaeota archaeon]
MKWSIIKENWNTTKHKLQVMRFMLKVCFRIIRRAWVHDFSKYSKHEAPYFAAAGNTKDIRYNSPEYKESVEVKLKSALEHHYKNNTHHPQHFKEGVKEMQPLDVIEMLCDWKASTLRYKGGNIQESLSVNKERFGFSEQEMKNYEKFFNEIKAW